MRVLGRSHPGPRRPGPWGDLPLSFHPFFELTGGERSLSLGFGSITLSIWNRRSSFSLTLGIDGTLSAECLVTVDPVEEFRLSGVLRGSARIGSDPRLLSLAGWLRRAGEGRQLGPAEDLPELVGSLLPTLETRAQGLRLTPRTRPGEGVRFVGSLTYLWWSAVAPRRAFEEIRLTGKVGMTRGERGVRLGGQVRARSRSPEISLLSEGLGSLEALPCPWTGWWSGESLARAVAARPWELVPSLI